MSKNNNRFANPHKKSRKQNYQSQAESSENSENIYPDSSGAESDSDYAQYGNRKTIDQYPQLLPLSSLTQMQQPMMNPMMSMGMGTQPMNHGMMQMMAPNPQVMPLGNLNEEKSGKKKSRNEIRALEKKIRSLESENDSLLRDNELLENKCEEYLSQLQRSADIIESTKDKQKIQIEAYEDKILELQDFYESEKMKNQSLEIEIEKLLALNEDLNIREQKEHGELGSMIQDLRSKNMNLEKNLDDKTLDLEDVREQLRLLQIQRDNIHRENEELSEQIELGKSKNEVEEDKYFSLDADYKNLKEDYSMLREDNIKLESQNHSLEDRIDDKNKELERMRGELGVLERMISSLSSKNGREVPSPKEYFGRDLIDRSNRLSPKAYKHQDRDSPLKHRTIGGRKAKRTRFQDDSERQHAPNLSKNYGHRNQRDHFDHENLREDRYPEDMPRMEDGDPHAKMNQEDHFQIGGYGMREHTNHARGSRFDTKHNNFLNKRHIGDPDLRSSVEAKKKDAGGNILTWDQPYDKHDDQQEVKYEQKEARRRFMNDKHNASFKKNGEEEPIRGASRSRSRKRFEKSEEASRGQGRPVTKPTMHKLDHEMTQNEKVKIKLEKSLLQIQVSRDNARSQLEKLKRTKKKTGQILRRIRDLESDEAKLEKEISKIRVEIRNLKQII